MPGGAEAVPERQSDWSKTMSLYISPSTILRQRPPRSGTWPTDDFPFGRPYGASVTPAGEPARETGETGPAFEETYPKHPFSELVRLGVALAERLARLPRRTPR